MKFSILYARLVTALAIVAGAVFAMMVIAISIDVVLRSCCTSALFGLGDLTEYGLAVATFLGAPWVLSKNSHVSVDIVTMTLSVTARRRLGFVVDLLGAAICACLFWYVLKALMIAFDRGSMVRGIIVVPEWLTLASPTVSALLLAIGFLLRAFSGNDHEKPAVGL